MPKHGIDAGSKPDAIVPIDSSVSDTSTTDTSFGSGSDMGQVDQGLPDDSLPGPSSYPTPETNLKRAYTKLNVVASLAKNSGDLVDLLRRTILLVFDINCILGKKGSVRWTEVEQLCNKLTHLSGKGSSVTDDDIIAILEPLIEQIRQELADDSEQGPSGSTRYFKRKPKKVSLLIKLLKKKANISN